MFFGAQVSGTNRVVLENAKETVTLASGGPLRGCAMTVTAAPRLCTSPVPDLGEGSFAATGLQTRQGDGAASWAAGAGNEEWRLFLLAAIVLFFLDVAARRLAAPRELLGRALSRLRALRGLAGGPRLSSADVAGMVARAREEERSRTKKRLSGVAREGKVDPDLAAYLYIARLHSSRAAKEEGKKG